MNEHHKAAIATFITGFQLGVYRDTPDLSVEEANELAGRLLLDWAKRHLPEGA